MVGTASSATAAATAYGLSGTPNISVAVVSASSTITANKFVGDGSGLTGVTASGTGIIIKDGGSLVGTAGTINFGDSLSVSAISGAAVTVTGTTPNNLTPATMVVSGVTTATGGVIGDLTGDVTGNVSGTAGGLSGTPNITVGFANGTGVSVSGVTSTTSLEINSRYGVSTGFGTFVASAGVAHTVDTFTIATNNFKTAEYTLHLEETTNSQTEKVLVMQNGTTAFSNEYAVMYNGNLLVTIGATLASGTVKLEVTPRAGISGLTTYRFTRETMN